MEISSDLIFDLMFIISQSGKTRCQRTEIFPFKYWGRKFNILPLQNTGDKEKQDGSYNKIANIQLTKYLFTRDHSKRL